MHLPIPLDSCIGALGMDKRTSSVLPERSSLSGCAAGRTSRRNGAGLAASKRACGCSFAAHTVEEFWYAPR